MKTLPCLLLIGFISLNSSVLFAQKSIGVLGGVSRPNLLNGNKVGHEAHTNYQETTSVKTLFGIQCSNNIERKRKSFSLIYFNRKYYVYSYWGGLAVGSSVRYNVKSSHLLLNYKVGKYFANNPHLYADFGGHLGWAMRRKIRSQKGSTLALPGQPIINTSEVNDHARAVVNLFELGLGANLGYEFWIGEKINLCIEVKLGLAIHGAEDLNQFLFDQGAILGVSYLLNDLLAF